MADKVVSEFKVVETDDGYRVEIKGDKEQMKKWFENRRGFGRHGGMGFGPFWMMRRFFGRHHHGPWGRDWDEEEEEERPADKPKA